MNKQLKISNLSDLNRERDILREKIAQHEEVLRDHYDVLSKRLKPVFRIINFISGNRIFRQEENESNSSSSKRGWSTLLLEILAAGTLGGFIFNRTKKNAAKSLLAYALDQGIKFMKDKDLGEHFENIKEWISKFRKDNGENLEEDDLTDDEDDL